MTPLLDTLLAWLGTALAHGLVLGALAWACAPRLRSGALREALWIAVLIAPPLTALVHVSVAPRAAWVWRPAAATAPGSERLGASTRAAPVSLPGEERRAAREPSATASGSAAFVGGGRLAPALVLVWMCGVALGGARLLRARRRLARLAPVRYEGVDSELARSALRLAAAAGLRRPVRVGVSPRVDGPCALGADRVLLPPRALAELDGAGLEALLAHEVVHLARRDDLRRLATAVARTLLWPQPFAPLALRRAEAEAERACDRRASRWIGGGLPLARCLARAATWIAKRPSPGLASPMVSARSSLETRVRDLLALETENDMTRDKHFAIAQGAALGLFLVALACSGPGVAPDAAAPPDGLFVPADLPLDGAPAHYELAEDGDLVVHASGRAAESGAPSGTTIALPRASAPREQALLGVAETIARGIGPDEHVALGAHPSRAGDWELLRAELQRLGVSVRQELRARIGDGGAPRSSPPRFEVGVIVAVLVEGRKLDPQGEEPWSGEGPFRYDGTRRVGLSVDHAIGDVGFEGSRLPAGRGVTLEQLERALRSTLAERQDLGVVIDARPGTTYTDMTAVLDAVLRGGVDQVSFAGARTRR